MTDEPLERPWLSGQLKRVDELEALEENWDSYHGVPPTAASAVGVRSLLHMLSAWHTVQPRIRPQLVPTSEGGIDIVWREQGYELDIEIGPDGAISGYFRRLSDSAEMEWPPEDAEGIETL